MRLAAGRFPRCLPVLCGLSGPQLPPFPATSSFHRADWCHHQPQVFYALLSRETAKSRMCGDDRLILVSVCGDPDHRLRPRGGLPSVTEEIFHSLALAVLGHYTWLNTSASTDRRKIDPAVSPISRVFFERLMLPHEVGETQRLKNRRPSGVFQGQACCWSDPAEASLGGLVPAGSSCEHWTGQTARKFPPPAGECNFSAALSQTVRFGLINLTRFCSPRLTRCQKKNRNRMMLTALMRRWRRVVGRLVLAKRSDAAMSAPPGKKASRRWERSVSVSFAGERA